MMSLCCFRCWCGAALVILRSSIKSNCELCFIRQAVMAWEIPMQNSELHYSFICFIHYEASRKTVARNCSEFVDFYLPYREGFDSVWTPFCTVSSPEFCCLTLEPREPGLLLLSVICRQKLKFTSSSACSSLASCFLCRHHFDQQSSLCVYMGCWALSCQRQRWICACE